MPRQRGTTKSTYRGAGKSPPPPSSSSQSKKPSMPSTSKQPPNPTPKRGFLQDLASGFSFGAGAEMARSMVSGITPSLGESGQKTSQDEVPAPTPAPSRELCDALRHNWMLSCFDVDNDGSKITECRNILENLEKCQQEYPAV